MVYSATTTKYVFAMQPGDVFWCTADCGWITGHSYLTYGECARTAAAGGRAGGRAGGAGQRAGGAGPASPPSLLAGRISSSSCPCSACLACTSAGLAGAGTKPPLRLPLAPLPARQAPW